MRRLVFFMHASLDGFVARPGGEIDWVTVGEEMFDKAGMQTDASDTALYGSRTYKIMQDYWPTAADKPNPSKHDIQHSAWYNKVEKFVISKSMHGQRLSNATIISDDVFSWVKELKLKEGKDIVIFGSPGLGKLFMQQDLIDDYWLFINPIFLGKGLPLFDGTQPYLKLKLVSGEIFKSGVACLHYQPLR